MPNPSGFYSTLHPEIYHGHSKRAPFFEGWYFKFIDAGESAKFAVIPGVILGEQGHAFVQVLDGTSGRSAYFRYPAEAFQADRRTFDLRIGPNHFCLDKIELALDPALVVGPTGEVQLDLAFHGSLHFEGLSPWPVRLGSPGIMGPYAWVPWMECYHGVLSLDHAVRGMLQAGDRRFDFGGGRGYIEKDWGRSFPSAWVWFQSNHFGRPGVSLTGSVARIPWLGSSFEGFIIGLLVDERLYRFATYTGAQIARLDVTPERVEWKVHDRRLRLEMTVRRSRSGLLLGPTVREMGKRVLESMDAAVSVRLSTPRGQTLFEGEGKHTGLEVFGEVRKRS